MNPRTYLAGRVLEGLLSSNLSHALCEDLGVQSQKDLEVVGPIAEKKRERTLDLIRQLLPVLVDLGMAAAEAKEDASRVKLERDPRSGELMYVQSMPGQATTDAPPAMEVDEYGWCWDGLSASSLIGRVRLEPDRISPQVVSQDVDGLSVRLPAGVYARLLDHWYATEVGEVHETEAQTQVASDTSPEHLLFHRLWTKAVGTPRYDKDEWKQLALVVEDGPVRRADYQSAMAVLDDAHVPLESAARTLTLTERIAWLLARERAGLSGR